MNIPVQDQIDAKCCRKTGIPSKVVFTGLVKAITVVPSVSVFRIKGKC